MAIKTITTNLYTCDKCDYESSDGNDFMTSDLPSIVLSSDRDVVNTVWFKYGIMIAYAPNNYNPILCKKCMREVLLELVDKI